MPNARDFWAFCRERENIRLRRAEGAAPPWTSDPALRDYRFCHIRRADDRGTLFYRDTFVRGARSHDDLLYRTVLYRLVNNVGWFERLGAQHWSLAAWKRRRWGTVKAMFAAGPPASPAYLTFGNGAKGSTHLEALADALDWLVANTAALCPAVMRAGSIEDAWRALQDVPYVGPFVAMQVYRDLILTGRTPLSALDEDSFAYIGPGAKRGLELLYGEDYHYAEHYKRLRRLWERQPSWLEPKLVLPDVQHSLCEFRKHWNLKAWLSGAGPRPKVRKYL